MFPKTKYLIDQSFDPLTAVANGSSYYAYKYSFIKEKVLENALPHSIGLYIPSNRNNNNSIDFFAIKGDYLPFELTKMFWLNNDNQNNVTYELYIGESENITSPGMKSLGKIKINIPPNTKKYDFIMEVKIKISQNKNVEIIVKKTKDRSILGKLNVSMDMNSFYFSKFDDEKFNRKTKEIVTHLKKFMK